jgi:hypothetical protein
LSSATQRCCIACLKPKSDTSAETAACRAAMASKHPGQVWSGTVCCCSSMGMPLLTSDLWCTPAGAAGMLCQLQCFNTMCSAQTFSQAATPCRQQQAATACPAAVGLPSALPS